MHDAPNTNKKWKNCANTTEELNQISIFPKLYDGNLHVRFATVFKEKVLHLNETFINIQTL